MKQYNHWQKGSKILKDLFWKTLFFSFYFSVVPLGKILEYLQEDYEMMAKEMQHYTDEYKRTVVELRKEKL